MMRPLTITRRVHFRRANRGRKVMEEGAAKPAPDLGRVPRISRLMALAIHMDGLVRRGEVADYAELARLAHVSRARITQIMNLLHLAPDIQEEILELPRTAGGRDPVPERGLRGIAAVADWSGQRIVWGSLKGRVALGLDESPLPSLSPERTRNHTCVPPRKTDRRRSAGEVRSPTRLVSRDWT
jgi:hypothetical protein